MPLGSRTRSRNSGLQIDTLGVFTAGNQLVGKPYVLRIEETKDAVHLDYPKEGGPFESRKRDVAFDDVYATSGALYAPEHGSVNYVGKFRCQSLLPDDPYTLPASLMLDCVSHGPACWAKFKPAKPAVSLSVFIAELRDIPGLMFKKLNMFRNIGSNYLAYQFGWKPFLSDLRSWYDSIISIDQRIAQLRRDNGRWIKKGGDLFNRKDISTYTRTSYDDVTGEYRTPISSELVTTTSERCWFSGAFRYYIPGIDSAKWGKAKSILKLWDLEVGPEQIYQLIPFSWLVDWFTNVGDVIGNYASSIEDNLVAKYAYVMLEKRVEKVRTSKFSIMQITDEHWPYPTYSYPVLTCSASCTEVSKNRGVASPFGFSFNSGELSTYQLSILYALGISNLKV